MARMVLAKRRAKAARLAKDFLAADFRTTSYLRFSETWMSFEQLHCTASQMELPGKKLDGKGKNMIKTALFVRLEAKAGKEAEVETFLRGGLPLVMEEPATIAWFGIRLGPTTFGIFDAFPDEAGRQAHLSGKVAAALMAKAPELLAKPPVIEKIDVLAAKLPK